MTRPADEMSERELTPAEDAAIRSAHARSAHVIAMTGEREEERAAIVAWLRDGDGENAEKLCDALFAENKRQREKGVFVAQPYFNLFAAAIAHRDHLTQEKKG